MVCEQKDNPWKKGHRHAHRTPRRTTYVCIYNESKRNYEINPSSNPTAFISNIITDHHRISVLIVSLILSINCILLRLQSQASHLRFTLR